MREVHATSFLSTLVKEKSSLRLKASERGFKPIVISALEQEIDRQITQASQTDPIKGRGVTKSGRE